ncbi:MAG: hypothetical protein KU37_11615 [Sulfuricurvum sp. PC08-66]|nr:MAG: hypothetical protein KU37_11615 [Sulfuricurvum sp. PC08-66]
MKKQIVYAPEELKLLEEIERGEWQSQPLTPQAQEEWQSYARHTLAMSEKKQTTIRFSVSDLAAVKAKSKEMGINYQNIIQTLVHQYATGKIKLEL